MEENQDEKWYEGIFEIVCFVIIFIALVIVHTK